MPLRVDILRGLSLFKGLITVELALLNREPFDELCEANRPAMLEVIKDLATTLAYRLTATEGRLAAYLQFSSLLGRDTVGELQNVLYSIWQKPTGENNNSG